MNYLNLIWCRCRHRIQVADQHETRACVDIDGFHLKNWVNRAELTFRGNVFHCQGAAEREMTNQSLISILVIPNLMSKDGLCRYLARLSSAVDLQKTAIRPQHGSQADLEQEDCTMNQDPSLRAQKLPCLRTGCLELTARGRSNSRTVAGTFQIYVENTFISPGICLAALAALLWLG